MTIFKNIRKTLFVISCSLLVTATAHADDECGPGPVVVCNAATYADGITYNTAVDLSLTKTNTGVTTLTNNGINLTATGAALINWDSAIGGVTGQAGTGGPVIDVLSDTGNITVNTAAVTGTAASVTHGIRAHSTGGGDISISRSSGTVSATNAVSGVAGIEAVSNGGNLNIVTGGTTSGTQYGVLTETSGSGTTNITLNGSAQGGTAGVQMTGGTGAMTLTLNNGNFSASRSGGEPLVRAMSAGAVTFNVNGGQLGGFGAVSIPGGAEVFVSPSVLDFSGVTGPGVTINLAGGSTNSGRWLMAGGTSHLSDGNDVLNMAGVGTNVMYDGTLLHFGNGNDVFNLGGRLSMSASAGVAAQQDQATLDFGGGDNVFNVSGILAISGQHSEILNLQEFNLSGTVLMGPEIRRPTQNISVNFSQTSGTTGDVLRLDGVTFTGTGDARVMMDVRLEPGAATTDLLDLRGSSTAGSTRLLLANQGPSATLGGYGTLLTLVDVSGDGDTAAEHFTLDPASTGYGVDAQYGPLLQRPGLFSYRLAYDEANQRHVLAGVPRAEVFEYAVLGSAAHNIWHMTGEAVTNRQANLRENQEGSVWLRMTADHATRDMRTDVESLGHTFSRDTSYGLDAEALMGGIDLVSGNRGGFQHALGLQMGYVRARADLKASPSSAYFTGATLGAYGSLWNERFFLDGALHTNFLALDYQSSGLGVKTTTRLESYGAHAEGGLRFEFAERYFAEPLATVAWVNTTFEQLSLFGGEIEPDDAASLRGALGLRLGAEWQGENVDGNYFVTGRVWNESDGESGVVVKNPGPDLQLTDDFSGSFTEFAIGLNVHNKADTLSGYLSAGWKDKDDYDASNISAGVRWRW